MDRSGFSTVTDADRQDAVRVAWVLIATLLFVTALCGLSFVLFDRPSLRPTSRPAWLLTPHSTERAFGHSNATDLH